MSSIMNSPVTIPTTTPSVVVDERDFDLTDNLMGKISFLTNGAIHMDNPSAGNTELLDSMISTEEEKQPYPEFEAGPFEGVEKRLIVEFYPEALNASPLLKNGSLRSLSATQWQSMLDKAKCQILSFKELETESGSCTAYLLSESSLFVYDHRVVLKTCGTTTPLLALPTVISFVTGSNNRCASTTEGSATLSESSDLTQKATTTPLKAGLQFDLASLASRTTAGTLCPTTTTQPNGSAVMASLTSLSRDLRIEEEEDSDDELSPRDALRNHHHNQNCCHQTLMHESPLPRSLLATPEPSFFGSNSDIDEASPSALTASVSMMMEDEMLLLSSTTSPIKTVISMPCLTSPSSEAEEENQSLHERPSKSEIAAAVQERIENDVTWIAAEAPRVVSWILFSHLTYCFPEKQRYPHRSNDEEIEYLDQFCRQEGVPKQSVDVFSLRTSEHREFFVYAYNNEVTEAKASMTQRLSKTPFVISELMMLGINEHCVDDFAGKGDGYNADVATTKNAAVQHLMKPLSKSNSHWNSALDQFWFSPCGYSCNALMEDATLCEDDASTLMAKPFGPHFTTAHISPEPASSYASLEATFPFDLKNKKINHAGTTATTTTATAFALCPVNALTTFNPRSVHVVEVELGGDQLGATMLGGGSEEEEQQHQLTSATSQYQLMNMKEFKGEWFHVRHAEYLRLEA